MNSLERNRDSFVVVCCFFYLAKCCNCNICWQRQRGVYFNSSVLPVVRQRAALLDVAAHSFNPENYPSLRFTQLRIQPVLHFRRLKRATTRHLLSLQMAAFKRVYWPLPNLTSNLNEMPLSSEKKDRLCVGDGDANESAQMEK